MTEREAVERWLLRQGLPHLIEGYGASTGVFTRALPFLTLVLLFNVVGAFGDRFRGWTQAAVVVTSFLVTLTVVAIVNWLRGRRPFQLPSRVGLVELTLFVVLPTIPVLLFGSRRITALVTVVIVNLVILGFVYVIVSYGLVPMSRWAIMHTVRQVSQVLVLMGRALPLVLVLSAFLFLNAELWQVAQDFTPLTFWVTIGLFVLAALAFLSLRIPREIAQISRFESRARALDLARRSGSPLDVDAIASNTATGEAGEAPEAWIGAALTRDDRLNVALVVLFSLGVQVVLVSLVIGTFYLVFGLFAVRANTIQQWTTLSELPSSDILFGLKGTVFGTELALTVELVRVVGFLAAFSGLQFAVAAVTDATYREEFFDEVTTEVREALAVRALYVENLHAATGSVSP